MLGLKGKKIIVAGGATGIGAATAERLVSEGASVVIGDVNGEGARATAQRITENGGTAIPIEFDFSDETSINALVDNSISELGGLDGLFNVGADLSEGTFGSDRNILEMDTAVWRRTFEVNLIGYALSCKAVIPHMLEQGGGVIVNTSSGGAQAGDANAPAYLASKSAIGSLTRHVAAAWGQKGIRCNAVSPGLVLTETFLAADTAMLIEISSQFLRVPKLAQSEDLAAVVAFLLSDDSSYVSGQVLSATGGWTMRE